MAETEVKEKCPEGVGCSFIKHGSQLRHIATIPEPLERASGHDIKWGDGGNSTAYRCKMCDDIIYASSGP